VGVAGNIRTFTPPNTTSVKMKIQTKTPLGFMPAFESNCSGTVKVVRAETVQRPSSCHLPDWVSQATCTAWPAWFWQAFAQL
jgi:hypothetical protein